MTTNSAQPRFFATAADFRSWLEKNHNRASELWIGYFKKSSNRVAMTYREAVDEALCFGWIDGLTKSIDATRYMQRFTPRRPGSNWSLVNVRNVARLKSAGRMHPAGLAAFAARTKEKTGVYSFETRPEKLPRRSSKPSARTPSPGSSSLPSLPAIAAPPSGGSSARNKTPLASAA